MSRRFWRYPYGTVATIVGWFLPWRGSDEYGRRTIVWPVHPFGWLVIAYRTCRCEDCDETREQTARWEAEERAIET